VKIKIFKNKISILHGQFTEKFDQIKTKTNKKVILENLKV